MQKYPILVLIGPSGAGKTALLLEMLKRFPGLCAPIKSKVTRPRRNEQDNTFYDFVTAKEFEQLATQKHLFQRATFAGYNYGCDKEQTDAVVAEKIGMVILIQQSVADFQRAGYKLYLVKIIPQGHRPRMDATRQKEDAEREEIELMYNATVINSFAADGFAKAANELSKIIENIKKRVDDTSHADYA